MKTWVQNLLLVLTCTGLLAIPAAAQTFTTLYSFTNVSDGAYPLNSLILSGNTLYGTAARGGTNRYGTVFAINTDGTGFTNLYTFTTPSSLVFFNSNSDGAYPNCNLILSGNTLYGTAQTGGTNGQGTVFAINTDGTGFANLHNFTAPIDVGGTDYATNSDGALPMAGLILSGNILYGTAYFGGSFGSGTVFKLNTDGTGFTNLYSFTATYNSNHCHPVERGDVC
jgi:uncharacterized repeat protein (TIGR03803 family)